MLGRECLAYQNGAERVSGSSCSVQATQLLSERTLSKRLLYLFLCFAAASEAVPPTGTISVSEPNTSSSVVSYITPITCVVSFTHVVVAFNESMITRAATTVITGVTPVTSYTYSFQVSSTVNSEVSFYISVNTIWISTGEYNTVDTAQYSFTFYAFPPSITLELSGFPAEKTSSLSNDVFLRFNSTTEYDGNSHFNESLVSFNPAIEMTNFQRVDSMLYSFSFTLPTNSTDMVIGCSNSSDLFGVTIFRCDRCDWPEMCSAETTSVPEGLRVEFPFDIVVSPIPGLKTNEVVLTLEYDTMSPVVQLSAPTYAKGSFWLTVSWNERLSDLYAVSPTFDGGAVVTNTMELTTTSYQMLVEPVSTGTITVTINGTMDSIDLAGNDNNIDVGPERSTGDSAIVIFSEGPPLEGVVSFVYVRPRLDGEYPYNASTVSTHSLTVNWNSFDTAVRYDLQIDYGLNLSTGWVVGLTSNSYVFDDFVSSLGVEYVVSLVAYSYWDDARHHTTQFILPAIDLIADGSFPVIHVPDGLSPEQTPVAIHVVMPSGGFLTSVAYDSLTIRTFDLVGGDQDPCLVNSNSMTCTFLNFNIDSYGSEEFVVFQKPLRLQFNFGQAGWPYENHQPELYYWETWWEEWRPVVDTCPPEQVYDRWNPALAIYEVSVCHLTQFAIFKAYIEPTTSSPPVEVVREPSYDDPSFFIILAGCVLGSVIICCICYWGWVEPILKKKRPQTYAAIGIRPLRQRFPRRLGGTAVRVADAPQTTLLALPGAQTREPQPLPAIEDSVADHHPMISDHPFAPEADLEGTVHGGTSPLPVWADEPFETPPPDAESEKRRIDELARAMVPIDDAQTAVHVESTGASTRDEHDSEERLVDKLARVIPVADEEDPTDDAFGGLLTTIGLEDSHERSSSGSAQDRR